MKRNSVWVVEKLRKSRWIPWETGDHMTRKEVANEYLKSWREGAPGEKFRLRRYSAESEG